MRPTQNRRSRNLDRFRGFHDLRFRFDRAWPGNYTQGGSTYRNAVPHVYLRSGILDVSAGEYIGDVLGAGEAFRSSERSRSIPDASAFNIVQTLPGCFKHAGTVSGRLKTRFGLDDVGIMVFRRMKIMQCLHCA